MRSLLLWHTAPTLASCWAEPAGAHRSEMISTCELSKGVRAGEHVRGLGTYQSRSNSCSATDPCTALEAWSVNLQVGPEPLPSPSACRLLEIRYLVPCKSVHMDTCACRCPGCQHGERRQDQYPKGGASARLHMLDYVISAIAK